MIMIMMIIIMMIIILFSPLSKREWSVFKKPLRTIMVQQGESHSKFYSERIIRVR
jgi:hypothetical protein